MSDPILVISGDPMWTQQAVHLASALARENDAPLAIILMAPTANALYLGDGERETLLTLNQYRLIDELVAIAENYGVTAEWQLFEYSVYVDAIVDVAERIHASAVFAPAPRSRIATLSRLRLRWLRHSLRRPLFTLGPDDIDSQDAPVNGAMHAPASVGARN